MADYSGGHFANVLARNNVAANSGPPVGKVTRAPFIQGPDTVYGGGDYLAGTTTLNNTPQRAFLRVYEQASGVQAFGGWSDAQGAFRFNRVSLNLKFFIVAFDPVTGEQAVIFDRI